MPPPTPRVLMFGIESTSGTLAHYHDPSGNSIQEKENKIMVAPLAVRGTIEELEGDVDTDNVYITLPASAIPGGGADGTTLNGEVLEVAPGLDFLVIDPNGSGGTQLSIEELTGDADTDTHYIVTPKSLLGTSVTPGTEVEGWVFTGTNGPVLLIQV